MATRDELHDRVMMTWPGTGDGPASGLVARAGFRTLAAALSDGDVAHYVIDLPGSTPWERGIGTWDEGTGTLARTTILDGSEGPGVAVDFPEGDKQLFLSAFAADFGSIVDEAVAAHVAAADPHVVYAMNPVVLATVTTGGTAAAFSPTGFTAAEHASETVIVCQVTTTLIIQGIVAPTTASARAIRIANTGDRLVVLCPQHTTATAADRIAIRDAVFIRPGQSVSLYYASSRWRTSQILNLPQQMDVFEDFASNGVGAYYPLTNGTGATTVAATFLAGAPELPYGVRELSTGATSSSGNSWVQGGGLIGVPNTVQMGQGGLLHVGRVAPGSLSTAAQPADSYCGFHNKSANLGSTHSGAFWLYRESLSTSWRFCVADAGSETFATDLVTAPVVSATEFIWLVTFVNAAGTRADGLFSTDGVTWQELGSVTMASPPTALVSPSVGIAKQGAAGTARRLNVDLMAHACDGRRG